MCRGSARAHKPEVCINQGRSALLGPMYMLEKALMEAHGLAPRILLHLCDVCP